MGEENHSNDNAGCGILGKKISPIIERLNVEFETGVFTCCNNRGNDSKSSSLD